MEDECAICHKSLTGEGPTTCLREKGSTSINTVSEVRNDNVQTKPGMFVHVLCRRNYVHPRNQTLNHETENTAEKVLRSHSDESTFDFASRCLFCSKPAKHQSRKRGIDVFPVRTLDFQRTISTICNERSDEWAYEINSRLQSVIDLPAAEAVYHQTCNVNFRTKKQIPKQFQDDEPLTSSLGCKSPVGRPEDEEQAEAFVKVLRYIECYDNDVIVINDLVEMMSKICGEKAYSCKHMKRKIIEYFGNTIDVSNVEGKHDIVTFKQTTSSIIHNFHKHCKSLSEEEEKQKIISAAAKLIKSDILCLESPAETYPSFASVSSITENLEFLPKSLKLFLEHIIKSKDADIKTASVGQTIVQACRPKSIIAPLRIGLGIQLHHHFGSRYLVDILNTLGFSSSYWEVQRFERNAAAILATNIPFQDNENTFLQFVADNVDHNIRTLDGNGTFHGMGIIATTTPGTKLSIKVPKLNVQLDHLSAVRKIDIKYFVNLDSPSERLCFLHLPEKVSCDEFHSIDLLSKVVWSCRPNRPSWSGFMQMFEVCHDSFPGSSSVTFMPMIDLHPSDLTCINSTLHFVCEKAAQYAVTPVLTFDQPLFQKATYIVSLEPEKSPLKKLILRLGPFHAEMSFLGCIGHLMCNSGLQEIMETVYAPTAVTHMLSGKAVQRAVRAHMLIDTALHTVMLQETVKHKHVEGQVQPPGSSPMATTSEISETLNADVHTKALDAEGDLKDDVLQSTAHVTYLHEQHQSQNIKHVDLVELEELAKLYDKLENTEASIENTVEDTNLALINKKLQYLMMTLRGNRTATLWFQYIEMISILQQFIRAERTGNWNVHLTTLRSMLPFFAASGHNLYLKSAYLYLQNMLNLQQEHPDIYEAFRSGRHVIRRSDRYWAGLSSDLIIEQVLMRSLKTTGGLTRGRGMTEDQRTVWLSSMPLCAEMNTAMQEVTQTTYTASEQHKDASKSRISRDNKDTEILLEFLQSHNPFLLTDTDLRNIESGVTADQKVNVDCAREVGEQIVQNMVGQSVDAYTFKRSTQVTTLGHAMAVQVAGESVVIDPQLLFQRLLTASNRFPDQASDVFQFELCSVPSSLFDNSGLPREPQKAILADAIWKMGDCSPSASESLDAGSSAEHFSMNREFVIDGGSLLHKMPWSKGNSFGEICNQYKNYLLKKHKNITVVFDGYESGATTKDVTHMRRNKGNVGTAVRFSFDTILRSKKDAFLRDVENKQNFILLLGECFNGNDISVGHASGDADCLIVQTALDIAHRSDVTIIGEDTDLLVLLCHHIKDDHMNVCFMSDVEKRVGKAKKIWDIHKTKRVLGKDLCFCLPFLHSLTGCDTTSRIFGIGKACTLNIFKSNPEFRSICKSFVNAVDKDDIKHYGESALLIVFDAKPGENLDMLRYRKFASKAVCGSSTVLVHTLPPTSAAAAFHSLRAYHQTMTWIGNTCTDPTEFGWEMVANVLLPIKTNMPPAPENLLQVIRCSCKNGCDSKRCSCKKHGLDCSIGCKECRGVSCSNSPTLSEIESFVDNLSECP